MRDGKRKEQRVRTADEIKHEVVKSGRKRKWWSESEAEVVVNNLIYVGVFE